MKSAAGLGRVFALGALAAVAILGRPSPGMPLVAPAAAQGVEQTPAVHTNGTATVRVQPDSARVFFHVTNAEPTVHLVRAANARTANEVMGALEDLPIKRMFTKTSTVNVEVVWDRDRQLEIKGYRMVTQFTVRVVNDDVDDLAREAAMVVDVALGAGANEISQIMFFKEDDSKERRECLQLAVKAAERNAQAIAEAAGGKLGRPRSISGTPQYRSYGGHYNADMVQSMGPTGGGGEASSYSPGDVEIECSASVTYDFSP